MRANNDKLIQIQSVFYSIDDRTYAAKNFLSKHNRIFVKLEYVVSKIDKGQLISKCPFGVIVWTKIATKNLTNFCPRI